MNKRLLSKKVWYFRIRKALFCCFFILSGTAVVNAQTVVEITAGADEERSQHFAEKLMNILSAINEYQYNDTLYFSDEPGVESLMKIIREESFHSTRDTLQTVVLTVESDRYEVPGVYLQREGGNDYEYEEVVLTFNDNLELTHARLISDLQNYGHILNTALQPEPSEKESIYQFLDQFSDAFRNKNVSFLRNAFSDNALIISGSTTFGVTTMRRVSSSDYMIRMSDNIFVNNDDIDVSFDDVEIFRHPELAGIYGIIMYQTWDTDIYEDEGFLYLTLDISGDEPKILVRVWQEHEFETGQRVTATPDPKGLTIVPFSIELTAVSDNHNLVHTLGINEGMITVKINSEDHDLLNPEIFERWISEEIIRIESAEINMVSVEINDDKSVSFTFKADSTTSGQHIDTIAEIRETSLLSGTELHAKLYMQRNNVFNLYVLDENESPPSSPSIASLYGEKEFTMNTGPVNYKVYTEADQLLKSGISQKDIIRLMLLEGRYKIDFNSMGFDRKSLAFDIIQDEIISRNIRLDPIVTEKNKPSFFSKYKYWLIGSTAIAAGSAVLLIINSDSGQETFPTPPGRP